MNVQQLEELRSLYASHLIRPIAQSDTQELQNQQNCQPSQKSHHQVQNNGQGNEECLSYENKIDGNELGDINDDLLETSDDEVNENSKKTECKLYGENKPLIALKAPPISMDFSDHQQQMNSLHTSPHLNLDQLLSLNQALENSDLPLPHFTLPIVYCLDIDKIGRFPCIALQSLANEAIRMQNLRFQHINESMQAEATMQLWHAFRSNPEAIEKWMLKCALECSPCSGDYLNRDAIASLFGLLKGYTHHTLQYVFDLMQHAAEQRGMLDVERADLDDFLPIQVVCDFLHEFMCGFDQMMCAVGYHSESDGASTKLSSPSHIAPVKLSGTSNDEYFVSSPNNVLMGAKKQRKRHFSRGDINLADFSIPEEAKDQTIYDASGSTVL